MVSEAGLPGKNGAKKFVVLDSFGWARIGAEVFTEVSKGNEEGFFPRHPEKGWPDLQWFDFLNKVIKAEPVVVRGAMAFGLKAVARAMRHHGLVQTEWTDGPTDGLGAMVGAWSCDDEAQEAGCRMVELPLMESIGHYNQVDCKVLQEIVSYLRTNH